MQTGTRFERGGAEGGPGRIRRAARLFEALPRFRRELAQPVMYAVCTFLLSFVEWMGIPPAFCLAFIAAQRGQGGVLLFPFMGVAASIALRLIWRLPSDVWQYAGCLLLMLLMLIVKPGKPRTLAVMSGLCTLPRAAAFIIAGDIHMALMSLAAAPLCCAAALWLLHALDVVHNASHALTFRDKACAALLMSLLVTGSGCLRVWDVNLGQALAVVITLLAAHSAGMAGGGAAGLICGVSLALGGHDSRAALELILGGVTAGLLHKRSNRLYTALLFAAGQMLALYLSAGVWPAIPPITAGIACALFFPANLALSERIRSISMAAAPAGDGMEGAFVQSRLEKWEGAIRDMARALDEPREPALAKLRPISFEEAKARFEREMTQTHLSAFAATIRRVRELTMGETVGDIQAAYQINRAIRDTGFPAKLRYARRVEGHLQAEIETGPLSLAARQPERLLERLSKEHGLSLTVMASRKNRLELEERPLYSAHTGVSAICYKAPGQDAPAPPAEGGAKPAEQISGDGVFAKQLRGGRYLLMLSDGMGHGKAAHEESEKTLELLGLCIEAGYTRRQAITAVNGMMLSIMEGERFATVDMFDISLWTGEVRSEKLGACASFLVRGNYIKRIEGASLPLGILESVTPTSQSLRMHSGDILVLVSDGIADLYAEPKALERAILTGLYTQPQRMADAILRNALLVTGGAPRDDMTVITLLLVDRTRSEE